MEATHKDLRSEIYTGTISGCRNCGHTDASGKLYVFGVGTYALDPGQQPGDPGSYSKLISAEMDTEPFCCRPCREEWRRRVHP